MQDSRIIDSLGASWLGRAVVALYLSLLGLPVGAFERQLARTLSLP